MESNTSSLLASDDHGRTRSSEESSSSHSLGWTQQKQETGHCAYSDISGYVEKLHLDGKDIAKQGESSISEIEMMKARFAKLLLGEDMSGSGNGACTALAISNAVTNLCGTVFGQIWRLESLPLEKKAMWRREMQWLLCVSDYIVEFTPTWQTFPDGSKLEEILDGFEGMEFWYVDQGIIAPDGGSVPHQEEKWWLPVPRVPPGGLHESSRNHLQRKRDCTNQILKAAMAINGITLAEMEVPGSYLDALPKNGRACLGDLIYRYMTSDQFYPDCMIACLDLSSDHQALEIANRVEASIHLWQQKNAPRPIIGMNRSAKSSWEIVKDLMVVDLEKKDLLADRAKSFLLCLKQRFPCLPQSALDMSKIQNNKDVGKSILESYSRVLESLAFNIVARIDDLLYIDELMKHSDQLSSIPKVGMISRNSAVSPYPMPTSGVTPYKTAFTTPSFSPGQQYSEAATEDRSPLTNSSHATRVLTEYLSIDAHGNARGERRGLNSD